MSAVLALGSRGIAVPGLAPGGEAGLKVTFAAVATLASVALVIAVRGRSSGAPLTDARE